MQRDQCAEWYTVFLDDLERASGRRNFGLANRQRFDHNRLRAENICEQVGLIIDEADVYGIETFCASADTVAPAAEVRQIVSAEMGECGEALGGRCRIENNLDQPKKAIVLDNEF